MEWLIRKPIVYGGDFCHIVKQAVLNIVTEIRLNYYDCKSIKIKNNFFY